MATSQELIRALQDPGAYPHSPDQVSLLQTHISMLFFAGDRVYKVKKSVDLGFVDYSTVEKRKHFCEEEVRLNRRLAEDVYLGVAPITRDHQARVRVRGEGEIIDYAVEMKRLPADRMCSAMLERGEIDNSMLNVIADLLVKFHHRCATGSGVVEHATPDALRGQMRENFTQTERFVGRANDLGRGEITMSETLHRHLRRWCEHFLTRHDDLLQQRVVDGRIREGHGDIHAGNICLLDDRVVIYDCIEFTRRFRCRDVACEIGFLAMDLEYRGFRGFAGHLCRRYADLAADETFHKVLPFYKVHLAFVRAKVESLLAIDPDIGEASQQAARREAASYMHLAAACTLPPVALLTCGLPASGKSHLARALARPFEAVILRSDMIRKQLAGLRPTERGERADRDIYTPAFTERTYRAMVERAAEAMDAGRSVILDATFASREQRELALDLLRRRNAPYGVIHLNPPDAVIAVRMQRRAADRSEVSDADWAVYTRAKRSFQPPTELAWPELLTMTGAESMETAVSLAIGQLVAQMNGAAAAGTAGDRTEGLTER